MRNDIPIYEPGLTRTSLKPTFAVVLYDLDRGSGAGRGCRFDRGENAVAARRWNYRSILCLRGGPRGGGITEGVHRGSHERPFQWEPAMKSNG